MGVKLHVLIIGGFIYKNLLSLNGANMKNKFRGTLTCANCTNGNDNETVEMEFDEKIKKYVCPKCGDTHE